METQSLVLKLAELRAPERNVRTHPPKQIAELAKAVAMFGQTRPVVVDEANTVLAGNGLVAALKKLGREEAAVYRITGLTQTQKRKLMLSDNRVYDLGFDDHVGIIETIRTLDGDFDIPGFDAEVLKNLYAGDVEATKAAMDSYGILAPAEIAAAQQRDIPQPVAGAAPPAGAPEPPHDLICPNCGGVVPC